MKSNNKLKIIGVGGIFTAEDVINKLNFGCFISSSLYRLDL